MASAVNNELHIHAHLHGDLNAMPISIRITGPTARVIVLLLVVK